MCVDTTASVSTKVMGTSQRCEVGAEQTMRWLFCRAFFSSMPRALLGLDDLTIIVDGTGIVLKVLMSTAISILPSSPRKVGCVVGKTVFLQSVDSVITLFFIYSNLRWIHSAIV